MAVIHWSGAIIGLAIGIILILKKVNPFYALLIGAIIGGLVGGASLADTTQAVIDGTSSVMGAVIRVLSAGALAGILIESGAAEKIAETIVEKLGEKKAFLAIALSTMVISAVGVFIAVSVIIVAPIAISVAKKVGLSKSATLLAMTGGCKAGNIISPNPNTIAVAKGFNLDLVQVMMNGFIPAIVALIVTVLLATYLNKKWEPIKATDISEEDSKTSEDKPTFAKAVVAPIVAIMLLAISPIGSILNIPALAAIKIDSMIILPVSGIVGLIAMGKFKKVIPYTTSGINKMTSTAVILIGAGAIAGIISKSNISDAVVYCTQQIGISGVFIAPISGILMAAATGSTSTGSILAVGSFGETILSMGVKPLNAAIMVHTGSMVIDFLPHANFFHASANSVKMDMKERMKLIPFEAVVGGAMCIVATIIYGFLM